MSREEVQQKRRLLFGLTLPDINIFGEADDNTTQIETVESTVIRIATIGRDRVMVHLADQSVWQATEVAKIEPKVGDSVAIKHDALGSYLGYFNAARSIRIMRNR